MANSTKPLSQRDGFQVLKSSYNEVDTSLTTSGFLTAVVGRKIEQVISTTTVPDDTVTFTFSESGVTLYALKIIYTDDTQETMLSAERIS